MTINKEDFKNQLIAADNLGQLLTPKHDPYNLATSYNNFRTVLSYELADNLQSFINDENYTINEYENISFPNSPVYMEIIPDINSGFDIPSSGVTANSVFASSALDRLIAVSGQTSGWHLFGEDSNNINNKVNNGDLVFKGTLI